MRRVLLAMLLLAGVSHAQFWKPVPGSFSSVPTNGLVAYWTADSFTGQTDTQALTAPWVDSAPLALSGLHTSNATSASVPTYVANGINGHPAVRFASASSQYISVPNASDLSLQVPLSIWVVAKPNSLAANQSWITKLSSFAFGQKNASTALLWFSFKGKADVSSGLQWVATGAPQIFGVEVTSGAGGTVKFYLNSAAASDIVANSNTLTTNTNAVQIGGAATEYANSDIAVVAVYNRVLTDAERQRLVQALGAWYGIRVAPPIAIDPEPGYISTSGAIPLPANRTTAYPATALTTLSGWDGTGTCCTSQTLNVLQPDVLDTGTPGFGGHRYWMIYTAWNNSGGGGISNSGESNALSYSDDGTNWTKTGDDLCHTAAGTADPGLYLENGTLYLLHSLNVTTGNSRVGVQTTTDGVTFSGCSTILTVPSTNDAAVTPQIVWNPDTNLYELFTGVRDVTPHYVEKRTCASILGCDWTANGVTRLVFDMVPRFAPSPWHFTIRRYGRLYYMLLTSENGTSDRVLLATSTDGVNFHVGRRGLPQNPSTWPAWCGTGVGDWYRSSFSPISPGVWEFWGSCSGTFAANNIRIWRSTLYGWQQGPQ